MLLLFACGVWGAGEENIVVLLGVFGSGLGNIVAMRSRFPEEGESGTMDALAGGAAVDPPAALAPPFVSSVLMCCCFLCDGGSLPTEDGLLGVVVEDALEDDAALEEPLDERAGRFVDEPGEPVPASPLSFFGGGRGVNCGVCCPGAVGGAAGDDAPAAVVVGAGAATGPVVAESSPPGPPPPTLFLRPDIRWTTSADAGAQEAAEPARRGPNGIRHQLQAATSPFVLVESTAALGSARQVNSSTHERTRDESNPRHDDAGFVPLRSAGGWASTGERKLEI